VSALRTTLHTHSCGLGKRGTTFQVLPRNLVDGYSKDARHQMKARSSSGKRSRKETSTIHDSESETDHEQTPFRDRRAIKISCDDWDNEAGHGINCESASSLPDYEQEYEEKES